MAEIKLGNVQLGIEYIKIEDRLLSDIKCDLDSYVRYAINNLSSYRQINKMNDDCFEHIECDLYKALDIIENLK